MASALIALGLLLAAACLGAAGDSISVELGGARRHPIHHRHHHRPRTSAAKVDEQPLPPIVVSSSDNSYVSASPFAVAEPATTEASPPQARPGNQNRWPKSRGEENNKQHKRRRKASAGYLASPPAASSDISTTATTTQRTSLRRPAHRGFAAQPRRQRLDDELDEPNDEDEEEDDEDDDEEDLDVDDDQNQVVAPNEIGEQVLPSLAKKHQMGVGTKFNVKPATIIKTRESILMGATFINYTLVTNLNACLVECWITDSCDTAIYQETPVDFNNHLPSSSPPPPPPSPLFEGASNPPPPTSRRQKQQQQQQAYNYLPASLSHMSSPTLLPPSPITRQARKDRLLLDKFSNDDLEEAELVDDDDDDDDDEDDADEQQVDEEEEEAAMDGDGSRDDYALLTDDDDDEKPRPRPKRRRGRGGGDDELGFFVCYLFQCAKPDGFKCQFSAHNYYISSMKTTTRLRPPRGGGQARVAAASAAHHQQQATHSHQATTQTFSPKQVELGSSAAAAADAQVQFNQIRPVYQDKRDEARYSSMIDDHQHLEGGGDKHPGWLNKQARLSQARPWHDVHHASISIEQEDYSRLGGGLNSAFIAIMMGIGATGMIIVVVGHKMKSIRQRIAYKASRPNKRPAATALLPPDANYLITTMPM